MSVGVACPVVFQLEQPIGMVERCRDRNQRHRTDRHRLVVSQKLRERICQPKGAPRARVKLLPDPRTLREIGLFPARVLTSVCPSRALTVGRADSPFDDFVLIVADRPRACALPTAPLKDDMVTREGRFRRNRAGGVTEYAPIRYSET